MGSDNRGLGLPYGDRRTSVISRQILRPVFLEPTRFMLNHASRLIFVGSKKTGLSIRDLKRFQLYGSADKPFYCLAYLAPRGKLPWRGLDT